MLNLDEQTARRLEGLPAYTRGWFQIAWSEDVPVGSVRTVHYFGQDIVLFRNQDGVLATSKVKKWVLEEKYGIVYVFFDPTGKACNYAIPDFPDFYKHRWTKFLKCRPVIRTRAQELVENGVDHVHFHVLHKMKPPSMQIVEEGTALYVTQELVHKTWIKEFKTQMNIHVIEPGMHSLYFKNLPLGHFGFMITSMTPINENQVVNFMSISVENKFPIISRLLQKMIAKNALKNLEQDRLIWENKIYLRNPVLCKGDGAIFKVRRWYQQFLPE